MDSRHPATMQYQSGVGFTIEDPGHLEHKNVIERVGVIVLHCGYDELYELHVHVLQPGVAAVEHDGDLFSVLLPAPEESLVGMKA